MAVNSTPYSVPVVEYEDEIDTTSTVNGTVLGVEQASKHVGCNGCSKRDVKILTTNKAICNLQQLPSTSPIYWSQRIVVKPKN